MSWKLHFISHTHWDREWYETFEGFRFRLVRLIDHLLEILTQNPRYQSFLLDGQTVVLEDYLAIRPEKERELRHFIENGRILIGPWYVLPDEFLVSAETHVRNLLFGKRGAQRLGGRPMMAGYLPDSFGHIAQMPQILKKAGIDYATFWRGVPQAVTQSEFFWEAPDGSRVLVLYMPFGYGIATDLPKEENKLIGRVTKLIENLTPFATTSHLLLMNGSDHVEPDPELSEKLAILQKAFPQHDIIHSNFPYLFEQLTKEIPQLPVYRGAWRANDRTYLLSGTLSTRVYLKQKHTTLSHQLEGHIEPLFTLLSLFDHPYPPEISYLWQILLHNSPHDSICGCGIDPLHEEMMQRYARMETVIEKLLKEANQLMDHWGEEKGECLVLFNPHPYPVTAFLEGEIILGKQKIKEVNFEIGKLVSHPIEEQRWYAALKLESEEETVIPTILARERTTVVEFPPHTLPEVFSAYRYRVAFLAQHLPPCGFRVYSVTEGNETPPSEKRDPHLLENEFYLLTLDEEGHFCLTGKESGKTLSFQLFLEDGGDAGDEYDYSPPVNDLVITTQGKKGRLEALPSHPFSQGTRMVYHLSIPRSLNEDRRSRSEETAALPVTIDAELHRGIKRIDLTVTVENSAKDHRLRLILATPLSKTRSFAGAHFGVLEEEKATECTVPQKDFVLLQNDEWALAVFNQGLHEYTILPTAEGDELAITLLRCVGWLSREDLLTRPGEAGWPLATPQAQCLGKHVFHLALCVTPLSFPTYPFAHEARLFNRPPILFQTSVLPRPLFPEQSFLRIDNPHIILSALKKHETREELVLRLYNSTPLPQTCTLTVNMPISSWKELTLLEEEKEIIPLPPLKTQTVALTFLPYEIKTLGMVR